jgi:hypothetical protein
MIEATALCFVILLIGLFRGNTKEVILLIPILLLANMVQSLPIHDFIIHTLLVFIFAFSVKILAVPLCQAACSILALWFLVMFVCDILDIIFNHDISWIIVLSVFNLYTYLYYLTIAFIIIGLVRENKDGHRHRNITTRSMLRYISDNITNTRRIRSKYN